MSDYNLLDCVDMHNKKFPIDLDGEEIFIRVSTFEHVGGDKLYLAEFPNYLESFTVHSSFEDFASVASFTEHAFGECLIDICDRKPIRDEEEV